MREAKEAAAVLYNEKESQRLSTTKRTFPKLGILELGLLNELRKVKFEEGTSPKLEKVIIEDCHSDLTICGISSLQSLEEILHFTRRKLVKVDRPHQNVETHGSHPLLQAEQSQSSHD